MQHEVLAIQNFNLCKAEIERRADYAQQKWERADQRRQLRQREWTDW